MYINVDISICMTYVHRSLTCVRWPYIYLYIYILPDEFSKFNPPLHYIYVYVSALQPPNIYCKVVDNKPVRAY